MRNKVDLPQPEGPTTATKSPRSTFRSMPSSATVPVSNFLTTSEKTICIGAVSLRASASCIVFASSI